MTQIADINAAVIVILKADADVITEVGPRVFGDELPRNETDDMPRKAIVVAAGGGTSPSYASATVPIEAKRIDVFCYGETLFEAESVRRAVFGAFRAIISRTVSANVLINSIRPAGGAIAGRDPDGDWPIKWNSWQVEAAEDPVT